MIRPTTPQKGGLLNRRLFLNSAIATTAALATTRAAYGQEIVGEGQEDWVLYPGSVPFEYSDRSRFEVDKVKRAFPEFSQEFWDLRLSKYVARTPLDHMLGTITPSGLHFERSHQGIPDIDPDQHSLVIHGMVKTAAEV